MGKKDTKKKPAVKRFKCERCGTKYGSNSELLRHRWVHLDPASLENCPYPGCDHRYRGRAGDVRAHWATRHRGVPYPEGHKWIKYPQILKRSNLELVEPATESSPGTASTADSSTTSLQPEAPINGPPMTTFLPVSPSTAFTSIAPLNPDGDVTQAGYLNPVKEHMHTANITQQYNFYTYDMPPAIANAATQPFPSPQHIYPMSYPSVGVDPISHPSALAHAHSPYCPGLTQTFNYPYNPGYTHWVNPIAGNYTYHMTTPVEPGIFSPQPVYANNPYTVDNLDTLAEQGHPY